MNKSLLYIYFFLFSMTLVGQTDVFNKANEWYENEEYASAIELYDSLVNQGNINDELFYNLGNAHYQMGNISYAILNYEKALKINPGNQKASNNLKIALTKTLDKIEPEAQTLLDWILIQASFLRTNGWAWLSVVLSLLTLGCFFLFKWMETPWIKKTSFYSGSIVALLFLLSVVTTVIKSKRLNTVTKAVVVAQLVDVKSSPAENSETVFTLHEGAVTNIMSRNDEWMEININQGNIGWVKLKDLEQVAID